VRQHGNPGRRQPDRLPQRYIGQLPLTIHNKPSQKSAMPAVVVLHDPVEEGAGPDARDTLIQAHCVRGALMRLGYDTAMLAASANIRTVQEDLLRLQPDLVFNLVESNPGLGQHIDRVPRLLDELGAPYTGCSAEVLRHTSNKLHAKQVMTWYGLPTAALWNGEGNGSWIIKSVWEHASYGIDDGCVVAGHKVEAAMAGRKRSLGGFWFAERYLDGREINIALLETRRAPQVLAIAEIDFLDYATDKPRIVGYAAKWLEDSFEYRNTPRRFIRSADEPNLRAVLIKLALRCWNKFGLTGYARVDLRIDQQNRPWLLEVNANPCLSPDAGFAAAAAESGLTYDEAIARIVSNARYGRRGDSAPPITENVA
jgi:D-alanine-D-alanine ligase